MGLAVAGRVRGRHLLLAAVLGLLVGGATFAACWSDGGAVQGSHQTSLVAGWNSVCHVGAEEAVADALAEVTDDVLAVYRLRADQGYDRWFADRPDLSTISSLRSYEPLFILMAAGAVWEQTPQSSSPASADLTQGWNSVCYGGQSAPASQATTGIEGSFDIIYVLGTDQQWARFVPGRPEVTTLGDLSPFESVLVLVTREGGTRWTFEGGDGGPSGVGEIRGDGATRLTAYADPISAQNPAFSPDGSAIIFTTFADGYNSGPAAIRRIGTDGEDLGVVVPADCDCQNVNLPGASWNSVIERIAFASDREEKDEIWSARPDGSELVRITHHAGPEHFQEPSYSPDGEWIVFEVGSGGAGEPVGSLWKMQADGTELAQLTSADDDAVDDRQPNWSPKGNRVVFQRRVPPDGAWDIFTMKVDGSDLRNVTQSSVSDDTDASWSPDGQFIVYSSDYGGLLVPSIYLVPSGGGQPIRVTYSDSQEDAAPSISPDGQWVAFESRTSQDENTPAEIWKTAVPPSAWASWPGWARTARIAGAQFEPEDGETEIGERLDALAGQGVSVALVDCPLGWSYSAVHDDGEFAENLDLVRRVVTEAHQRNLRVVWYLTGLELISPAGRNPADEHPDWLQRSLDGTPIVFNDISSDEEHWLNPSEWDVWVSPCSGYRDLFLDRVRQIAGAGVDGLWVDTVYLQDAIGSHEDLLPSTDECSREGFETATGLTMPSDEDWEDPTFRRWIAWRHEQLREFLQAAREAASAENPDIVFFEENWNVDAPHSTRYANDPAAYTVLAGISTGHEISTIGDRTDLGEKGMQSATLDEWLSFVTMLKFARGADRGKPSWILTYGYQPADAERLAGVILAEGANYYETRGPSMADSVGDTYRTRIFAWIAENEDSFYESGSLAEVALLYSPRTRDLVDQGWGNFYDPFEAPFFREYRAAAAVLLRAHIPFDVVITDENLSAGLLASYDVVVLPHVVAMSDGEAAAIAQYASQGGLVVRVGGTGTHDEWFQARSQNALTDVETQYISSLITAAGAQTLGALADGGQMVTDAPVDVHIGLRGDDSSIEVVLVNLGQEPVTDVDLAISLLDGSTVESVRATSSDGEAQALDHSLEDGRVRFTLPRLQILTLVSIALGPG